VHGLVKRTMNTLRLVCPKRTGGVIWVGVKSCLTNIYCPSVCWSAEKCYCIWISWKNDTCCKGHKYPDLQYFAKRIVSQCMSSSGCERNWSTFALVHTKLRNRLSYDKLHKLVYVHYNLKLRIQLFQDEMKSLQDMQCHLESDSDPCSILMDCAMYDEDNPIMDWLCNSRS